MKPKLADILGKSPITASGGIEPEGDEGMGLPADDDMDEDVPSPEEISAVKLFERAKTPEDKASALKMFMKACMP